MNVRSRLNALTRKLKTSDVKGYCPRCGKSSLHYREGDPIPEPCPICGMIANSVVCVYTSETFELPEAFRGRYRRSITLPDNGRNPHLRK
jgi:hypothetical protein